MKQIIISIWIALLTLPVFAQQQMQAKVVLDKTAATFEKAGGICAEFNVTVFNKSRMAGQSARTTWKISSVMQTARILNQMH